MLKETKKITPAIRDTLPGDFIQLPDGVTQYEWGGPPDGHKIVLVHGFTTPYFIWDPTFEALTQTGFRVLRYNLFGRGYSDRPFKRYNLNLFNKQLYDLLEALEIAEPVHILGLSMGGTITANFAANYPDKIKKVGLLAPAGFSLRLRHMKIPLVGELIMHLLSNKTIKDGIASDFVDKKSVDEFYEQFMPQTYYKGFRRAILSTIRSGILTSGVGVYERLGKIGLPTILFWGEDDKTVPFEYSAEVVNAIPDIQFHPVSEVGHLPHVEKASEINSKLIEFLSG